jgi:GAF domain-containing protein
VLDYLLKLTDLTWSEFWLTGLNEDHIKLIQSSSKDKAGQLFHAKSKNINVFKFGEGLPGIVWQQKKATHWNNIHKKEEFIRNKAAKAAGIKSTYGIPIIHNNKAIGAILFGSKKQASDFANLKVLFKKYFSKMACLKFSRHFQNTKPTKASKKVKLI